MSSPIAGFYLSARNRRQKAIFERSSRTLISMAICLESLGKVLISDNANCAIGESITFQSGSHLIEVNTRLLTSGTLHVVCFIFADTLIAQQEFNLLPNEPITSAIDNHEQMIITAMAKPCAEAISAR